MRLGDAEREALFEQLSRHAAEGRLDVEELERRIARIAQAQTRQDADAVLADLPPLPAQSLPPDRRRPWFGRGHGEVERPDPAWRATDERFRDPRSGRIMRVWVSADGARHYIPDDA